jgi:hypothetical protein
MAGLLSHNSCSHNFATYTINLAASGGVWLHSELPIALPLYDMVTISTEFVAVS